MMGLPAAAGLNKDVRDFMLRHKFTGADLEKSHGPKIDNFEGGWTKNRQFMGVRTLPEALLSINKRGSVCVHKNSF